MIQLLEGIQSFTNIFFGFSDTLKFISLFSQLLVSSAKFFHLVLESLFSDTWVEFTQEFRSVF
jgi:hypothetical protein